MKDYKRVYATVNLDAVRANMEAMRNNIPEQTGMIGVVKTDGYGHGAVPVALAVEDYVKGYAVAACEEALQLRQHGITKPILVLGVVPDVQYREMIEQEIRPAMFEEHRLKAFSDLAVRLGRKAPVHLALDTGMSRIGMEPDEASADMVKRASELPGITLEGMFTHFAKADETDKTFANLQLERYMRFVKLLEDRGVEIPVKHCSNSAGIIERIGSGLDMVRAGITIYGMDPSNETTKGVVPLQRVLELKSFITYIKTIQPGTGVSYGATFLAKRPTRVATVSIGYGDGYPRNLSGKGFVLIHGNRVPILGRVCMDQLMVDVTGVPEASEGDEVTLIGKDGAEEITVEELAAIGGGFHYEIVCDIGKRVPRVYLQGGKVIGTKDYFEDCYQGFGTCR